MWLSSVDAARRTNSVVRVSGRSAYLTVSGDGSLDAHRMAAKLVRARRFGVRQAGQRMVSSALGWIVEAGTRFQRSSCLRICSAASMLSGPLVHMA